MHVFTANHSTDHHIKVTTSCIMITLTYGRIPCRLTLIINVQSRSCTHAYLILYMCKHTARWRTVLVADLELEDLCASLSLLLSVTLTVRNNPKKLAVGCNWTQLACCHVSPSFRVRVLLTWRTRSGQKSIELKAVQLMAPKHQESLCAT